MRLCCNNRISFGYLVVWILLEIFIVQALCLCNFRNGYLNLAGFLLCISSTGTFAVWGILRRQVQLALLGLTLKEQTSRIRAAGFEDDPREEIPVRQKCGNLE
jgi:hypothetical protein